MLAIEIEVTSKKRTEYVELTTGNFDRVKTIIENAITKAIENGEMEKYEKLAGALDKIVAKIKKAKAKAIKDFEDTLLPKTVED